MKARYRRRCPENCSYRDRRTGFCGFCMLDILERERGNKKMQMMIDNSERSREDSRKKPDIVVSELKDLRQLANAIPDGVVLSVDLEEVTSDGQKEK